MNEAATLNKSPDRIAAVAVRVAVRRWFGFLREAT
ncbi:MAG: hypothetical protein JWN70_1844 [Planctomycetaceae bacterium]|nr:hypothetical protein [Planctomycetaceae bacterium]